MTETLVIEGVGNNTNECLDSLIQVELLIALTGKKSNEGWNRWFQRDYVRQTQSRLPRIIVYPATAEYMYHLHDGGYQNIIKANELEKIEAWLNSQ